MSSRAQLVLANGDVRKRAHHWINIAPAGTRVEFKQPQRTLDQNSLLWALLMDLSRQVDWYGQKLSPDDWKTVTTASLRKCRVVPGIDHGTVVPLGLSTSRMSKDEFSNLIELIRAFGAEQGVTFTDNSVAP
jgi:hypothetical protein